VAYFARAAIVHRICDDDIGRVDSVVGVCVCACVVKLMPTTVGVCRLVQTNSANIWFHFDTIVRNH